MDRRSSEGVHACHCESANPLCPGMPHNEEAFWRYIAFETAQTLRILHYSAFWPSGIAQILSWQCHACMYGKMLGA